MPGVTIKNCCECEVKNMSLNKAIEHGKEKRKPYRGAKAMCSACCNHGSDDWDLNDRVHKYRKVETSAQEQLKDIDSD